jgi:hypothetical protein
MLWAANRWCNHSRSTAELLSAGMGLQLNVHSPDKKFIKAVPEP